MEAYDETPISQHKFLPIVSLGDADDKFISWGATIPDKNGNYYYTSFSSAGYVLPYLFVKLFRLPINEKSLYIFNTFLFAISALIWIVLLNKIYKDSKNRKAILLIGVLAYIFSPELLHGMGIVYWHQSVMQVTLLIQLSAYYAWKEENSKDAKIVFYVMSVINPYVEWTGYIANVGYALSELGLNWKKDIKRKWTNVFILFVLTIFSFGLFTLHYISVVNSSDFFTALKNRFFARNFNNSSTLLTDVFGGYLKSFLLIWILLFFLIIWNIVRTGRIELKHKYLMFIMIFPLLENVIMKEHALSYTYDRMKMIFILSFIVCELVKQLLESYKIKKKLVSIVLCTITFLLCIGNLRYYINDTKYIWEIDYRDSNEILASYINENYSNSVLVTNTAVRGYINLLFGCGIYEGYNIDGAISIANEKKKENAIEILIEETNSWNMYKLSGAIVYNTFTGKCETIKIQSDNSIDVN